MITFEEARRKVQQYLREMEAESREVAELRKDLCAEERKLLGLGGADEVLDLTLADDDTVEGDFGWVFTYQSRAFVETGDDSAMLVGNAPILVSRSDGRLHVTGTDQSVEFYIANFKRCGDPHG